MKSLYYESHITIEPVFDGRRELARQAVAPFNFRLADLLMQKARQEAAVPSTLDTFMTGHAVVYAYLEERTIGAVKALQHNGFKVYRYKIEDCVLDSRKDDALGLLSEEAVTVTRLSEPWPTWGVLGHYGTPLLVHGDYNLLVDLDTVTWGAMHLGRYVTVGNLATSVEDAQAQAEKWLRSVISAVKTK